MQMFQHQTLVIGLKTTRFNDSESSLFMRDDDFIHGALSDLSLFWMILFTLHEISSSEIHHRGTLSV